MCSFKMRPLFATHQHTQKVPHNARRRHCDRGKFGGTHSLISFKVKNARSAGVASEMGALRSRKAGRGIGPSQVATAYSSRSLRLRDRSIKLDGRQINCPVSNKYKQHNWIIKMVKVGTRRGVWGISGLWCATYSMSFSRLVVSCLRPASTTSFDIAFQDETCDIRFRGNERRSGVGGGRGR